MGQINKTIEVFERLRKNTYSIAIENGTVINFRFMTNNYHHLAGFQHLNDFPHISDPRDKDRFYRDIRKARIAEAEISSSVHYWRIQDRIQNFGKLEDMLKPGESKVIIQFDGSIPYSKIKATYFLFERDGAAFTGNVTYYHLFFGYDTEKCMYYPATFIVEHSNVYVREQEFLNCVIEVLPRT